MYAMLKAMGVTDKSNEGYALAKSGIQRHALLCKLHPSEEIRQKTF